MINNVSTDKFDRQMEIFEKRAENIDDLYCKNLKKAARKRDLSSNKAQADKEYKKKAEKEYEKYTKKMDKLEQDAEKWAEKEDVKFKANPDVNSKNLGDKIFPTFRLRSSLISL